MSNRFSAIARRRRTERRDPSIEENERAMDALYGLHGHMKSKEKRRGKNKKMARRRR